MEVGVGRHGGGGHTTPEVLENAGFNIRQNFNLAFSNS